MQKQVAIWVDDDEARVFEIHLHPVDQLTSRAVSRVRRLRPAASSGHRPLERAAEGTSFHREVLRVLDGTEELLVLGPAAPKADLLQYMLAHHRPRVAHVVGARTTAAPTDAQLLAYAKWHFRSSNRRVGGE